MILVSEKDLGSSTSDVTKEIMVEKLNFEIKRENMLT